MFRLIKISNQVVHVSTSVVWCLFAFFLVFQPHIALGAEPEEILSFQSDITIKQDGSLGVVETIVVRSDRRAIRHGIFRELPIKIRTRWGEYDDTKYKIESVKRNGQEEEWRKELYITKSLVKGVRIYIGKKDFVLARGVHTYEISYSVRGQTRFLPDYDELFFNVTGPDWRFPINSAEAHVHYPAGISPSSLKIKTFKGKIGPSKDEEVTKKIDQSEILVQTTKPLTPGEALAFIVTIPKGYISPPTEKERLFDDDRNCAIWLTGLVAIFGYYLFAWLKVGKDPSQGVIIPRYSAPDEISAADARYLILADYDDKAFAAQLVGLAAKNAIKISQTEAHYKITKQAVDEKSNPLTPSEKLVYDQLFAKAEELTVGQSYDPIVSQTSSSLSSALKERHNEKNLLLNLPYLVFGAVVSAAIVIVLSLLYIPKGAQFGVIMFAFDIAIVIVVLISVAQLVPKMSGSLRSKVFAVLFVLIFLLKPTHYIDYSLISAAASSAVLVIIALMAFVICVFSFLLKAPTKKGRKILDELEGLKMYMVVAEKDRLNSMYSLQNTPEEFEKLLPYALAFDIEQKWAERFSEILQHSIIDQSNQNSSSHRFPLTNNFYFSFSDAVSTSATSPSSAGGSSGGGGGFSGGGGGGGW